MKTFVDAAFGDDPGRWPLPAASTPREHWLRAVSAGGQGRYASGVTDLDALERLGADRSLGSLAFSTRASFLRQLGGHRTARGWDGRAWAVAGPDVAAGADALIGLAADALGVGRFGASIRLLQRSVDVLGKDAVGRQPVRLAWVCAELAMAMGDGAASVGHAERAVDMAAQFASTRHVVKSQVVLAAALCSAGETDTSREVADTALAETERLGLIPLSWASACLLTDIGSAVHSPSQIRAARDGFAETVRRRGGTWSAR
jgi:hypothetical protein